MNKIAQQFQNDVVVRYQQKMAELVKRAEDEQKQQPQPDPQQPQPYPTNIREMDPRRAAEALDFESRIYGPMIHPDNGDIENNYMRTVSPVTGLEQSMPQRYADTAMEAASGMNLPRPPYTPKVNNRYFHPNFTQLQDLYAEPYGQGFADDIAYDGKNMTALPTADNPGTILRRQQNYYPRGFSPYNYPRQ